MDSQNKKKKEKPCVSAKQGGKKYATKIRPKDYICSNSGVMGVIFCLEKVLFLNQWFSGFLSSVRVQAVDSTTSRHIQRNEERRDENNKM